MQYVPEKFLKIKFNDRIARMVHQVLQIRVLSVPLLWVLKKLVKKGTSAKMIAFLNIGLKKTQDMVFEDLISNYPEEDNPAFVILPLDFTYMGAGALNISYEQQLEDLFALKLRYPDNCYPFVAIDPRGGSSSYNLQFVENYIRRGFTGIKLYPALGYFPFDLRLEYVYRFAEKNNLPIMTHCSTGGVNYVGNKPTPEMVHPTPFNPISGKTYYFPAATGESMSLYCDNFNNPTHFEEALCYFPSLKICFAHIGLNADNKFGKLRKRGIPVLEWFNKILDLMRRYNNVYTDISYSVAYDGFVQWFLMQYSNWPSEIQGRILFGTDYFMTVQEEYGDDSLILQTLKNEMPADIFYKIAVKNPQIYLSSSI